MQAFIAEELATEPNPRDPAKPFTIAALMMKTAAPTDLGRKWHTLASAALDREDRLVKQDWFTPPGPGAAALDTVINSLP